MNKKNQINKGILVLLFIFFGMYNAQAQVSFQPGFRGGANFSHFTKGDYYYYNDPMDTRSDDNYSSITNFYIGFYGALKLTRHYTLQPEINYSAQGSDYRSATVNKNFKVDYLCFQMMNKFTFTDKFNVHFGPTLEFVVDKNFDVDADVDLAFVLGTGINITRNLGIELRVKKGIVPVIDFSDNSHTNVVFSVGGTYTFDVK
ncbi:outer membrane protein with beta-barrel domain [Flavobacterium sp. 1]|uniref:outer membrane beta-barrel protein n=1 Tax=Flavobacterium sp. 1 TaxID=2035200 RepID=UPI000C244311|nr:outer membrane beta-barrel protein [Flavobacterium sp. 1]PJJ07528.1 outer membrane protein with beta-barrel domain [Flavobacterium sp. 1]